MNDAPDARKAAAAGRELALLQEQAASTRSELTALRRELADARRGMGDLLAVQLLEANEQLVLAALRAETMADTAVHTLDELTQVSQLDPLTQTPNRALMLDRLQSAIGMARRHGTWVGVLFLDMDHFKEVNDTLGHSVGDEVLRLVARRLEAVVRDSDTVSRHGGDEFLVLLAELENAPDAWLIAAKVKSALSEPALVAGHALDLSASVGVATFPEDGDDAQALIRQADASMYRAKRSRPGGSGPRDAPMGDDTPTRPSPDGPDALAAGAGSLAPGTPRAQMRDLQEANQRLVITALAAQETQEIAEAAGRRQVRFLTRAVQELRHSLVPLRLAARQLRHAERDKNLLARLQETIEGRAADMSRRINELLAAARALWDGTRTP